MSVAQIPPVQTDGPAPAPRCRNFLTAHLRPAIVMTLLFAILTGLIYPGVVTGIAQLIFPSQANGSLLTVNGKVIGSALIGQYWNSPKYFHGRPSATLSPSGTPSPYEADNSAGSNLGPTNSKLLTGNGSNYQGVANYAAQFRKENNLAANVPLPSDIVTASASGLDPDISPEAALLQVNRVARVRGLSASQVHQLVSDHIQGRFLWIFGEPYVNVLQLNIALDALQK